MKNKQRHFSKIFQQSYCLKKLFWLTGILLFFSYWSVSAYEIKDIPIETKDDFVLEPAKVEVSLDPGSFQTEVLSILNRTNKELDFKVEIEDFVGSQNPNQTVVLMGEEKGPYSLKDYLVPEISAFTLKPGQRMILPVVLAIPKDVGPGGLYGSVLISSQSAVQGQMGATIVSRLGTLFFVNIRGETIPEGKLTSFEKKESEDGQISFDLLFTNGGNIYLAPHGFIRIFDLFGTEVGEIEIEPFFAMPDSVRYRNIVWNNEGNLFGKYKAIVSLNRGYDDKVDEMAVVFWAVSTKMKATTVGVIILLILIIIWLIKIFFLRLRKKKFGNKVVTEVEQNLEQTNNLEKNTNNFQNNSQNQNNSSTNNSVL